MWKRQHIDDLRVDAAPRLTRVVCAIDPPMAWGTHDLCVILVAGLGVDGHAYVLRDASIAGNEPSDWARAAAGACSQHNATPIVEHGQSAHLVGMVMNSVGLGCITYRHRNLGRWHRLEPVAAIYAEGRVHHVGHLDALEQDMVYFDGMHHGEPCERLDALGTAISCLMLKSPNINIRAL